MRNFFVFVLGFFLIQFGVSENYGEGLGSTIKKFGDEIYKKQIGTKNKLYRKTYMFIVVSKYILIDTKKNINIYKKNEYKREEIRNVYRISKNILKKFLEEQYRSNKHIKDIKEINIIINEIDRYMAPYLTNINK